MFAGVVAAGVMSGCCDYTYDDLVDPCWPQRYACQARGEVNTPLATQAANGLVLEQTVWNYHFDLKKDDKGKVYSDLTPGGRAHLAYLARRRPAPITDIYLQTAQDVAYDSAKPDQFVQDRAELDAARVKAVTDYLSAVRPDVPFRVCVHDPHEVGLHGKEVRRAIGAMHNSPVGSLPAGSFGGGVPVHGSAGRGADPTAQGTQGIDQNVNQAVQQQVDQEVNQPGVVPSTPDVPPVPVPAPAGGGLPPRQP
jgi:hypothetical protein